MKKAVFTLFFLSFCFILSLQAQELTGLLDPAYQLLWGLDEQVIKLDSSVLGISKDTAGNTYLLFPNGEFKEVVGDKVNILENAGAKPAKIFQYQIGKRGQI